MAADPRSQAARVLAQVLEGRSLNQALPPALERVAPTDRALLQQLCYGCLREAPRLQGYLDQLLEKPLRDKDRDVQALILCGLYQLEATRIPDHAAVAETVAATKALQKPWSRGLCNAILRRFLRERESLAAQLSPAQRAAHPDWLYGKLKKQWPDQLDSIIEAGNSHPPMTLRVNAARSSREASLEKLAAAGIDARAGDCSPQAIYLATPADVAELPGFAAGEISVQDEAAQLAAQLLQAGPGEKVLDACAAPGGKACHILELDPALGELVALDVDATRLARVEENLARLGLSARCLAGDGANPSEDLKSAAPFDRILVDAPCSASGVIRRHPDIKLLRRPDDIASLAQQQLAILAGLWPLLKPGGKLLYATCSILREENDAVVAQFLGERTDAELLRPQADWGELTECGRQLLPRRDGPDGLYYALIEKA